MLVDDSISLLFQFFVVLYVEPLRGFDCSKDVVSRSRNLGPTIFTIPVDIGEPPASDLLSQRQSFDGDFPLW